MAKRVRTTKTSVSEVVESEAPVLPASPAASEKALRASRLAANPGKAKAPEPALTDGQQSKHAMLPAFLSKTFEIFSMSEFATICGWNASGDTIIVSQLEAFVSLVLPRFFKHRNFPSFVRQLNLYGFHKTVLDSKRLEFQHPYFKRDRPDLLQYIKRKVSTGNPANQQQQSNSRLDVHREISDQLLKEMKELRQRSETMEKRLRELEVDNAIVRSDNMKLWKHLESAKDKQLIMQEKMKKIMWILFQIYRGKQGSLPKLGGHNQEEIISEDYINSSRLGPKEFRDVLRFLAMDEPPLLPNSSTDTTALNGRKRKFIEVPATEDATLGDDLFKTVPSSVVEITSPVRATTAAAARPASVMPAVADAASTNTLSIFSPQLPVPRITPSESPALFPAVPVPTTTAITEASAASSLPSTTTLVAAPASHTIPESAESLDFIDEDLPLLNDSEQYPFGEDEEQHVMKKLEDFESSLLDEYDVGCLDTLLQQLKAANAEKAAIALPPLDPDEIVAGGPEENAHLSS